MKQIAETIDRALRARLANGTGDQAARRFKFGEIVCDVRLPAGTGGFGHRWRAFAADAPPAFAANVLVDPEAGPIAAAGVQALIPEGDGKPTRSFWINGAGFLVGRYVVARLDPADRRIDILVPGAEHVPAAAVAVRFGLVHALTEAGGFFLHCAGLVNGRTALLFFGPSESGKSTLAEVADADAVLSDEAVIVRKTDGRWTAYGTPFSGALGAGENVHAEPGAFVRLTKADEDEPMACERLHARRAAQEVLRSVIALDDGPDSKARAAHCALRALGTIPVYEFRFRPEPTAWPFVLDQLRSGATVD